MMNTQLRLMVVVCNIAVDAGRRKTDAQSDETRLYIVDYK